MDNRLPQRIKTLARSLPWDWLPDITTYSIEQAALLQQIPAPTFAEQDRADYVRDQFEDFELDDIEIDALFNVYGCLPGRDSSLPALAVTAHTDTVFPAETELSLRRSGMTMAGPGLGDNCFGLAGLLGLLASLRRLNYQPERDIYFVATSREEGMGDLGGMKAAFEKLSARIGAVINLEGLAFGHVYHSAIAVRRLHITAEADGGHSWLHFGRASAVHGILDLGHRLLSIDLPKTPRSTYNVGVIEGGQGINVIATSAGMWLDMRSEEPQSLAWLEAQVRDLVAACQTPDLRFAVEVVGDRPAGSIDPQHELVRGALAALEEVGILGTLETGSTDANIPLAAGCPAITIGITRGGNAHRLDEYVELEPVEAGLRQLILLTLAASGAE